MKIRKSFKQKNVAIDNCMYTERELCQLLADRKIWCFGNDYGVCYEYMGESTEYRVFTEAEPKENQVYTKGDYDRSERKYECGKFSDISYTRYIDGNKEVYTDFVF